MCGLFGFFDRRQLPSWESHLRSAVDSLRHRGPDDRGEFLEPGPHGWTGLGHRRLSIRDLSPRARQPFVTPDRKLALVANGEIYNAEPLRDALERRGHRFVSQSDSEVLLHGYREYGPEIARRVEGMLAFAIWDAEKQRILIGRDRLGIKPLLYARTDHGIAFGSELRGLLDWPGVSSNLCPRGVHEFLTHGYVTTPHTIVESVQKLRPGHIAHYDLATGEFREEAYWSLENAFRAGGASAADPSQAFWELFESAVDKRLVSDVPVGVYLSGGLDSRSVAAVATRKSNEQLTSLCCEFQERTYSEGDEARRVAEQLSLDHQSFVLPAPSADEFSRLVRLADEPLADTSFVACERLAAFARQHATVILSGDGADELLAGYITYRADRYHRLVQKLPLPVRHFLSNQVATKIPTGWSRVGPAFKARQFLGAAPCDAVLAHQRWRTLWWPNELETILDSDTLSALRQHDPNRNPREAFERLHDLPFLEQSLYVDLTTWLVDDILHKVDRASMAHGLEVRVPFLDHHLVEFCAALPSEWKLQGSTGKRILRHALAANAPELPPQRGKKGFNAPVGHWLNGPLRSVLEELKHDSPDHDWLRSTPDLRRRIAEHQSGRSDHGLKLWPLAWLVEWTRQTGATLSNRAEPRVGRETLLPQG